MGDYITGGCIPGCRRIWKASPKGDIWTQIRRMAWVSRACYNKTPQTGWLKTRDLFSHSLEAWSLKLKGQQRYALYKTLSRLLLCLSLTSWCITNTCLCGHRYSPCVSLMVPGQQSHGTESPPSPSMPSSATTLFPFKVTSWVTGGQEFNIPLVGTQFTHNRGLGAD